MGAALGITMVLVLWLGRKILFPTFALPKPDGRPPADAQRWSLDVEGGEVEAWFLPGDGASAQAPAPAVIFAHGNGELIDHWPGPLGAYRRLGVSVLLMEYRGYGRSAGAPSEEAIVGDAVRFYDRLVALPEVDPARIVFHGRSLGGGVVTALAARRKPAAMILMSTFRSFAHLARAYGVPRFLVLDPFDSEAVLQAHPDIPLLVVHGRRDDLVPVDHGEALAGLVDDGRLVLYDAGHNDCPPTWPPFWREVEGFLRAQSVLP